MLFEEKGVTTFCEDYCPYNIMKVVCLSAFLSLKCDGIRKSIFDKMGGFYSIVKSPISGLVNNW